MLDVFIGVQGLEIQEPQNTQYWNYRAILLSLMWCRSSHLKNQAISPSTTFYIFLLEQFGSSHLKNQAISPFSRNSYGFEPWGSGNLNVIGRQVPALLYAHPPALTVCNSGLRPQLFVTWSFTFEIKLPSQFLNPLSLNLRLWSMLELCLSRPSAIFCWGDSTSCCQVCSSPPPLKTAKVWQ